MKPSDYNDAEKYLDKRDEDIKRDYEGRGYDELSKTEQQQALLDIFFDGKHRYDLSAQQMRDGLGLEAKTPEVSWIDHKGKPHIHPSIKGADRRRVERHDKAYVKARRAKDSKGRFKYSRTQALRRARREEYRGMSKTEIKSYNGRIGARQRWLKYSVVKLPRKGYMPHGWVYAKHLVERDKKGRFVKWHKE
jgi:hypothetical protein